MPIPSEAVKEFDATGITLSALNAFGKLTGNHLLSHAASLAGTVNRWSDQELAQYRRRALTEWRRACAFELYDRWQAELVSQACDPAVEAPASASDIPDEFMIEADQIAAEQTWEELTFHERVAVKAPRSLPSKLSSISLLAPGESSVLYSIYGGRDPEGVKGFLAAKVEHVDKSYFAEIRERTTRRAALLADEIKASWVSELQRLEASRLRTQRPRPERAEKIAVGCYGISSDEVEAGLELGQAHAREVRRRVAEANGVPLLPAEPTSIGRTLDPHQVGYGIGPGRPALSGENASVPALESGYSLG